MIQTVPKVLLVLFEHLSRGLPSLVLMFTILEVMLPIKIREHRK